MTLLSIQDLRVRFRTRQPGRGIEQHLVVGSDAQGISFNIAEHRSVALVGESGSGKTVTAMSLLGLLPDNAACEGRIDFQGRDLLQLGRREL
ncbi:MAG: ATP-binding cassette domain-containing protein, partial [Burkholderiales bacterium]